MGTGGRIVGDQRIIFVLSIVFTAPTALQKSTSSLNRGRQRITCDSISKT